MASSIPSPTAGVPSDRELTAAALSGDREAFGALAERHSRPAFEVALAIVRTTHEASDMVQESLLRAWQALDRFIPGRPFAPWFYRIVRNTSIQHHRGRRRHPVLSLQAISDDEGARWQIADRAAAMPEELLMKQEQALGFRRAFERFPERERRLMKAHGQGMSYHEIAQDLGISSNQVRSGLKMARARAHRLLPDALGYSLPVREMARQVA